MSELEARIAALEAQLAQERAACKAHIDGTKATQAIALAEAEKVRAHALEKLARTEARVLALEKRLHAHGILDEP